MMVAFQNVLSSAVNEFFRGALDVNPATQLLIFVPKSDCSFPDPSDATLRDGWAPDIATGILQKMPFVFERLNLDVPPTFLKVSE
jgi:hypothetical protein